MKTRQELIAEAHKNVGEFKNKAFRTNNTSPVDGESYKLGYADGYVIGYEKCAAENPWIEVDGWKNVPVGEWLFKIENRQGKIEYHTGHVSENNFCVIGGIFGWDREKVFAYKQIPI